MRLTVLGPVRVWRDGIELTLGPPKQRALLALLLVRAGQPVSLSEMVDVLWGPAPPKSAANVVHRHVGSIRRLLGEGGPAGVAGGILVRGAGGYRVDVDAGALDLLRFRQLAGQARRAAAAGSPGRSVELFLQALELWQGPVAAGVPEGIRAHPAFVAVDQEYPAAVKEAAEAAWERGDPEQAVPVLRQAADRYPLDEALQARLMRALAATGRQAEALEAHRTLRSRLKEELGIDPGREVRAVHEQMLRQGSPILPVSPATPPPVPRTPGLRSGVRPAQLPSDLPFFTGRRAELTRTRELLAVPAGEPGMHESPPALVISAIGGMAGIGKTTLAVHWAHQVAHHFPDGQLYANLRGFDPAGSVTSSGEALRAFLHALGVPPTGIPAGVDAQAALYRSLLSGRRMLVLLDNVRDSAHARPLLPGTPGCLVIVTSRSRLDGLIVADGARPLPLGLMSKADAREALARRLGADRMAAEPSAVDTIIELCGRLPLALAVVAARAATRPGFPLAAIATELRDSAGSLDAFAGSDPGADVRTVFSWSYQALDPPAARLFRLLALHPGPDLSLPAAASLAGLPAVETRPLLAALTRLHLLTEEAPGRFTFHDLLRTYATERARADDPDDIRRAARHRVLDHYLRTTRAAVQLLLPHRTEHVPPPPSPPHTAPEHLTTQEHAASWLTTRLPVLLCAVEQAAATGFPTYAWQLALALDLFLDRRGLRQEQLTIQRTALDAAERLPDRLGQAHAHRALGFAHHRLHQDDDAQAHLLRALEIFTALDRRDGQARTHRSLAFMANSQARHHQALDHYGQALDLYESTGNDSGRANVLNETGWTHILLGQFGEALIQCRQALAVHQRAGDPNGEAAAWDSLGYAHHHLAQYEDALACYHNALAIYQDIKDRYLEADTLDHIGDTHHALGDRRAADARWRQALDILAAMGHPDAVPLLDKIHGTTTGPR
ncbi:BTAD domain-containing putative transcriptional regulator [Streptomyces sp. NPDC007100]|uniref:AfsR/SARP family transcriptional regulator n=1 Tax=Streptomyces sp. NPDC007100 TaxID=3155602 RepID=UPI0033C62ACB